MKPFALFLSLIFITPIAFATPTLVFEKIQANQIDRTAYAESRITVKTTSNHEYVKIHLAYDLKCEQETFAFEHAKTSIDIPNPYGNGVFTTIYTISNGTDDSTHHNGYKMAKAWKWLLENTSKTVECNFKYQAKAGFSNNTMSTSLSLPNLPISLSFGNGVDTSTSTLSTRRFEMHPPGHSGGGQGCVAHCTPLLIDLGKDGIHLGQKDVGVWFDMLGNGEQHFMQWVAPNENEAFLFRDINGNGIADDGSELFGSGTMILQDEYNQYYAPNGFVALAQFDQYHLGGNDDGLISDEDYIWSSLFLWLDINADGVSSLDEIIPLSHANITNINTIPKESNRQDAAGNLLPLWSTAQQQTGSLNNKLNVVDVYFKKLD